MYMYDVYVYSTKDNLYLVICTIGAMKKSQKLKKNSIPDQNHDLLYKADKVSTNNNDDVWKVLLMWSRKRR